MSGQYVSFTNEDARAEISHGVFLVQQTRSYGYEGSTLSTYKTHDLDGLTGTDLNQLATLALLLQNLPEEGVLDMDHDALQELLKDWAADTAEGAELPFTFTDNEGSTSTYTPASLWESSGSCEWETSAQEGYDYGWNI